jgi:hypothetical protein
VYEKMLLRSVGESPFCCWCMSFRLLVRLLLSVRSLPKGIRYPNSDRADLQNTLFHTGWGGGAGGALLRA